MARILIGNVKGPIGATGPVGPRGPEGPQGIQGPLCPLTNNALATVPGVAALDAVMGKTLSDKDTALQNEVTQLNSDLPKTQDGIILKSKYITWSVNVTAGVIYSGAANFAGIGIIPEKVLDCVLIPHNSLPHQTFMSYMSGVVYAYSTTYSGQVTYGVLVFYTD